MKDEEKIKATLEEALKNLTETTKNMSKTEIPKELENDEMFKKIFGMFQGEQSEEKLGETLEKIMETLLSPKVLKDPMVQLKNKYPEWLQANKGKISEQEYNKIYQQYQYACKIVEVYENDPNNTMKLVDLMKEMQELGSPPQEILDQLSVDSGSMPNLPDMDKCPMQ